MIYKIMRHFF